MRALRRPKEGDGLAFLPWRLPGPTSDLPQRLQVPGFVLGVVGTALAVLRDLQGALLILVLVAIVPLVARWARRFGWVQTGAGIALLGAVVGIGSVMLGAGIQRVASRESATLVALMDVRNASNGDTVWVPSSAGGEGDTLQWLFYVRVENAAIEDVALNVELPPGLTPVARSVRWVYRATDGRDRDVVQDESLFTQWVKVDRWQPGGGFFFRFDTIITEPICSDSLRLHGRARGSNVPQRIVVSEVLPINGAPECNVSPAT